MNVHVNDERERSQCQHQFKIFTAIIENIIIKYLRENHRTKYLRHMRVEGEGGTNLKRLH